MDLNKEQLREYLQKRNVFHTIDFNDITSAKLFADTFKNTCRFCPTANEWFFYDGKVWSEDVKALKTKEALKLLAETLASLAADAGRTEQEKRHFMGVAARWLNADYRKKILTDSQSCYPVALTDFDRDNYLFNMQNGVLRLCDDGTVKLLPHNPDLLLSKVASVFYNPDAKCERFNAFLSQVMEQDVEKIEYLQKWHGYILTGSTKEEKMLMYYGASARNGKGTLVETVRYMMGSYAATIMPKVLAARDKSNGNEASPELAKLTGVRYLTCSEWPRELRIDEALLKALTGRDTISARKLHGNPFDINPNFKYCVNTNYLPIVRDPLVFSSGRIQLVEFNHHFTEGERDTELKDAFLRKDAQSAILNWAVEGWRLYCDKGLTSPKSVKVAVDEYAAESDEIQNFINEALERSEDGSTLKAVYSAYVDWFKAGSGGSFYGLRKSEVKNELARKGLFRERGTVNGRQCNNVVVGWRPKLNDGAEIDMKRMRETYYTRTA